MPLNEVPPPLGFDIGEKPGQQLAHVRTEIPGPISADWKARLTACECPCVFQAPSHNIMPNMSLPMERIDGLPEQLVPSAVSDVVYTAALGSNVVDADGNRFVDMAGCFGALLLGHRFPHIEKAVEIQLTRTWTALGDVYAADAKIALLERIVELYTASFQRPARAMLGLSGSDAVTCALKTAMLYTGKPGVIAFEGAYHGMSYAPLAACGYNPRFRSPFASQLNPHVRFVDYPFTDSDLDRVLQQVQLQLNKGDVGAVIVEPVLGRGGCVVPPNAFLPRLESLVHNASALVIVDEIWTGLGRTGSMLASFSAGIHPDLLCLGKGLGGGLPLSACVGIQEIMLAWSRSPGVVHTATMQGHALCCAAGVATLDALRSMKFDQRAERVGEAFKQWLQSALAPFAVVRQITGKGLMIGVAFENGFSASQVAEKLLKKGFIVVTGGSHGHVLTLTPALNIDEVLLESFVDTLADIARDL